MGTVSSRIKPLEISSRDRTTEGQKDAPIDEEEVEELSRERRKTTALEATADDGNRAANNSADGGEKNAPSSSDENEKLLVTWPCANCHSTVSSNDRKCPACGGILVKTAPANCRNAGTGLTVYLERVKSPTTPRETPTNEFAASKLIDMKATAKSVSDDVIKLSSCDEKKMSEKWLCSPDFSGKREDDADDDDEVEEDLEASPKHDIIVEKDDLCRPIDPVAMLLASAPSPAVGVPATTMMPTKLDIDSSAASAGVVVAAMMEEEESPPVEPGPSGSRKHELDDCDVVVGATSQLGEQQQPQQGSSSTTEANKKQRRSPPQNEE